MKLKVLSVALILCFGAIVAWPSVARWKENRRRAAASYDVPQAERALRVPTEKDLRYALPGRSREVLENADRLVVYSIEPREDFDTSHETFHRYPILGQTVLTNAQEKRALLASLYDGFVPLPNSVSFGCFSPRHALRAQRGKQTMDFVICFSCGHFRVHLKPNEYPSSFITRSPQPAFDRILTEAGVPLAPR